MEAREVRTVNAGERGERDGESKRKLFDGEGVREGVPERFRCLREVELLMEGVGRGLGVGPDSEGRARSGLRWGEGEPEMERDFSDEGVARQTLKWVWPRDWAFSTLTLRFGLEAWCEVELEGGSIGKDVSMVKGGSRMEGSGGRNDSEAEDFLWRWRSDMADWLCYKTFDEIERARIQRKNSQCK